MKILLVYTLSLFAVISLILPDPPPTEGPHGGILKRSGGYYIEMLNHADTSLTAYLLSKRLKTVSNEDIFGDVKLFFPDSATVTAALKPLEDNALSAKIPPGYISCKISFFAYGRPVSAVFAQEDQITIKQDACSERKKYPEFQ